MPSRENSAATAERSAVAASPNIVRSRRSAVSTRSVRPVSGSMSVSSPTSTSSVLARVADLDREDRVAARDLGQGGAPVERPAEVGDDRHEARARARRGDRVQGPCQRRRAGTFLGCVGRERLAAGRASRCGRRPVARRDRWPVPKVTTPSRSERRATNRPTTRAAPSATSALRRSAVPKCIEADWSSTIHAVSWRSGTSSRTCGMKLRAVAFQSMRRTSSPGSYGRRRSRSRPSPRPRPRWSPVSRPPARRVSAISRRRTRSSAIGPGPGRAGDRSRPATRARSPVTRWPRGPFRRRLPRGRAVAPAPGQGRARRPCRG